MSKYEFIIFNEPLSSRDLKAIMYEGVICSRDCAITFYKPYKELYDAFKANYPTKEMWGIGFLSSIIDRKARFDGIQGISEDKEYNGLASKIQHAKIIDFSMLERKNGEVFFVVPKECDWREMWSSDVMDSKNEKWWCKGLCTLNCGRMRDEDIEKYLKGSTRRFHCSNYINKNEIQYEKIFPCSDLCMGDNIEREYSLLNNTPEDMQLRK